MLAFSFLSALFIIVFLCMQTHSVNGTFVNCNLILSFFCYFRLIVPRQKASKVKSTTATKRKMGGNSEASKSKKTNTTGTGNFE